MTGLAHRTISSAAVFAWRVEVAPPQVALVGVPSQFEEAVADRVAGGLVARRRQQDEERGDLHRRQPVAVDLGLDERGAQVVSRVDPAVLGHGHGIGGDLLRHRLEGGVVADVVVADAEDHVGPVEDPVLVLVGDAHHGADDLEGERGRELGDEVAAPVGMPLDHPGDESARPFGDGCLDLGDHLRGERLLHDAA